MKKANDGQVGTCRYCGRTVVMNGGHFFHSEMPQGCKHKTLSAEYCGIVRADGQRCARQIPIDNLIDDVYGCSYHVKQANQEKERLSRDEMREENRRNLAELEAYEMKVYQQAEDELRSKLGSDIFGDNHSVRYLRGVDILCRTVPVDWVELNNLI